jgi:hypothetical protein
MPLLHSLGCKSIPGPLASGSQVFPCPALSFHLLPLRYLLWACSRLQRQRGRKKILPVSPTLQCRSSSGWGVLFSPREGLVYRHSRHCGPTPSPSGHEGYRSGVGTRCRAMPAAAGGAGRGLLITCQVPGVVQGGFTLFKHQNNSRRSRLLGQPHPWR